MTQRAWFDLAAALRLSEHVLSHPTIDPHQPAGPTAASLLYIGGRWPRLSSNRLPALAAGNTITALHADGPVSTQRSETWLRLDDATDRITVRDLLRLGYRRSDYWFTVPSDGASPAIAATRDTVTVPDNAHWIAATISDPRLGTHCGQTAAGYRNRNRGGALVRIHDHDLWQLTTGGSAAATVRRHPDRHRLHLHLEAGGIGHPIDADTDGFYQLNHPGLRWTAVTDLPDPGDDVFAPDELGLRCTVCGAIVADDDIWDSPSMAGYGDDTSITCHLCGSYQTTDPIFGIRQHPAPWPPDTDTAAPAHPAMENPEDLP